MRRHHLFWYWLKARSMFLLYVAAVFGFFFLVYALYGYTSWGVAGYAALLGTALGLGIAIWDFSRYAAKCKGLCQLMGHFPIGTLPEAHTLLEQKYQSLIAMLEAERIRLEKANEHHQRDAEEYYTLWAHQIKTPIAAMRLLLQSGNGQIDITYKNELEQELFRIEQYVDMVLQYQRLSSLKDDLVLTQHTLTDLVNKAAKTCAPLFIHKGLALRTKDVHGVLVTDEKWFCFVLEQLLTNAAKYTAQGTVQVYSQSPDMLVVEDKGVGIPADDLPRVFERGFTGTVGRTERSSTGIGLYLCRQILARLGFGIRIESSTGKGTLVFLQLHQQSLDIE